MKREVTLRSWGKSLKRASSVTSNGQSPLIIEKLKTIMFCNNDVFIVLIHLLKILNKKEI